jgi:WD40 repeat protein
VIDITHESLIRQWKRMRGWADEEAHSVEDYRNLESAVRRYREQRGDLLSKLGLANALEWKRREQPTAAWAARYGGDFNQAIEFLDKSDRDARSTRRVAYGVVAFVFVLVAALLYTFSVASLLRHKNVVLAGKNEEINKANRLLGEQTKELDVRAAKNRVLLLTRLSRDHLAASPQQATLLAVEAVKAVAKVHDEQFPLALAGEEALRRALANIGGIGYAGHSSAIGALAIDPGGRFFATGAADDILLWDLKAGPGSRPIPLRAGATEPRVPAYGLAFLKDGRLISTDTQRLAVWDPKTPDVAPKLLWENARGNGPTEPVAPDPRSTLAPSFPAWSLRGRWLAVPRTNGIDVFDLQAPDPLKVRWSIAVAFPWDAMIFTNDDRYLVVYKLPAPTGEPQPQMGVWSLDTGTAVAPVRRAAFQGPLSYAFVTPGHRRLVFTLSSVGIFALELSGPKHEPITLLGTCTDWLGKSVVGMISQDGRWMLEIDGGRNLVRRDLNADDPRKTGLAMPGAEGRFYNLISDINARWAGAIDESATTMLVWDLSTLGGDKPPPPFITSGPLASTTGIEVSPEPAHRWLAGHGASNVVQLWDLQAPADSRTPIELRGHGQAVSSSQTTVDLCEFTPDGRSLFTAGADGTVRLWPLWGPGQADVRVPASVDPALLRGYGTAAQTTSFVRTPTGLTDDPPRLLLRRGDRLHVWDMTRQNPANDNPERSFSGIGDPGFTLGLSNRSLAVHLANGDAEVYDLGNFDAAAEPIRLRGARESDASHCVSPDGDWLVWSRQASGTVRLWGLKGKGPREPTPLKGADKWISTVVFPAGSRRLVLAGSDGEVRVWDLAGGLDAAPTSLKASSTMPLFDFTRDGRRAALVAVSPTAPAVVQVWDLAAKDAVKKLMELRPTAPPVNLQLVGSHRVLTEQNDGTVMLWKLEVPAQEPALLSKPSEAARPAAPALPGTSPAFGAGQTAAPSKSNQRLVLTPTAPGASFNTDYPPPQRWLVDASERWLVVSRDDGRADLFDVTAGDPARAVAVLSEPSPTAPVEFAEPGPRGSFPPPVVPGILRFSFSKNSRWLAHAADGTGVRLWSLDDPRAAPSVVTPVSESETPGTIDTGASFVFSDDGKSLLVTSNQGRAALWDLSAGRPTRKAALRSSGVTVREASLSPDGNRLIAIGFDGTVRLWSLDKPFAEPVNLSRDLPAGAPGVPTAAPAFATGIAFGPGGQSLIVPDSQGNVRIWSLPVSSLQNIALRATGRNLSAAEWDRDFPGERYEKTFDELSGQASKEQRFDSTQPFISNFARPSNSPNVYYLHPALPP